MDGLSGKHATHYNVQIGQLIARFFIRMFFWFGDDFYLFGLLCLQLDIALSDHELFMRLVAISNPIQLLA